MDNRWSSDWNRVTLPLAALHALEKESSHGYRLLERLTASGYPGITGSTLYPFLARLESQGWVQHEWDHSTNGPGRKIFSVTRSGSDHLTALTAEWLRVQATLNDIVSSRGNG